MQGVVQGEVEHVIAALSPVQAKHRDRPLIETQFYKIQKLIMDIHRTKYQRTWNAVKSIKEKEDTDKII